MTGSVLVFVANCHWRVRGRIQKLARNPSSLVSLQHDGADGALDTLDLHDLILQNISELFNIISQDQGHDVELASNLVEPSILSSLASAWTTSSMWADSTKMSTNASRGAMVVHRFRVLRLPPIPRFIDSLPRVASRRMESRVHMTIRFPKDHLSWASFS